MSYDNTIRARQQAVRRPTPTHRFALGAYVIHRVDVRSGKETFRVTRLLPEGSEGFQYRIKGERDGLERVVTESMLEALQ